MNADTKQTVTRALGWGIMATALYFYTNEVWAPLMIIGFALSTAVGFTEGNDE